MLLNGVSDVIKFIRDNDSANECSKRVILCKDVPYIHIHTYITICIARCVDSTEYMSNQRRLLNDVLLNLMSKPQDT